MKRIQSFKRVVINVLTSFGMIILISACSNGVKGEYVADTGGVLLNFKSGGIVEVNGTSYPYEQKEKVITIKENNLNENIIVMEDGTLQANTMGMLVTFKKKKS